MFGQFGSRARTDHTVWILVTCTSAGCAVGCTLVGPIGSGWSGHCGSLLGSGVSFSDADCGYRNQRITGVPEQRPRFRAMVPLETPYKPLRAKRHIDAVGITGQRRRPPRSRWRPRGEGLARLRSSLSGRWRWRALPDRTRGGCFDRPGSSPQRQVVPTSTGPATEERVAMSAQLLMRHLRNMPDTTRRCSPSCTPPTSERSPNTGTPTGATCRALDPAPTIRHCRRWPSDTSSTPRSPVLERCPRRSPTCRPLIE